MYANPCGLKRSANRIYEKKNKKQKQKWKRNTLDPDRSRWEVRVKCFGVYNWKRYLLREMLSPRVLVTIISGKTKLKTNFLLKFSSWSANQATNGLYIF